MEMKACPNRQVSSVAADWEVVNATRARLKRTRLNKAHVLEFP